MAYNVKFLTGTSEQFKGITPVDTTLYFLTDTQELYKGKTLFASGKAAADITSLAARVAMNEENIGTTTKMNVSIKALLDKLDGEASVEGSVKKQIADALASLDSTKSQAAGADGLALSITLTDGKVTGLSGSIAAETYDAYGAAAAVQGATSSTVKAVEDALGVEVNRAKAAEGTLTSLITDAKDNLVVAINEVDDHADKAQAAATKAQGEVDALETLVGSIPAGATATTVTGYVDEKAGAVAKDLTALTTRVTTAEADIDAIQADYLVGADKTELQGNIDTVSGKVTTLIGSDGGKSVRTIANEELTKQLIPENAGEALDTLQEIAAWIQAHPGDASAMNKAISDLETLVGTLPEGITATTVVGYVAELVAAEEARATGVEGGLNTRLQAVETKLGDGAGSVTEQIATAKQEAIDAAATDATTKANKALEDANAHSDSLNTAMNTRVTGLETKVGSESVSTQITTAINALDSTKSDTANGITVGVTQADGVITAVSVSATDIENCLTWGTIA